MIKSIDKVSLFMIVSKCDTTICVTANYDIRFSRLTQRLQYNIDSNYGDEPLDAYKPEIIEKRIKLTAFNELGYNFDEYIENNSDVETYHNNIKKLIVKL